MTLLLASKSETRRAMLDAAGVIYEAVAADLDERAIEAGIENCTSDELVCALAVAKAQAVSSQYRGRLVLGSDSLVTCGGRRFDKPRSREEAHRHLRFFSGRIMELHSAAALLREDGCQWCHAETARLHVRDLSEEFITSYLDHEWPQVRHCVGVFRIEARGVQLFRAVEGSHFTVLGMPLLPLLEALREMGEIEA